MAGRLPGADPIPKDRAQELQSSLETEAGVQVFVSPDLGVGPAVEALATVARRGVPEIILHTAKKPLTGWTLNGRAIEPAPKWESPDTPTVIPIVLLVGEDR